ncbi:MAG: glycosyltransferase family 39 protein [Myxococcales bacterium]|nr:glycosyltransferase family 39 protein [Myxococcales bacterium]
MEGKRRKGKGKGTGTGTGPSTGSTQGAGGAPSVRVEARPLGPVSRKERIRGGVLFLVGVVVTLLLMSNVEQLKHGAVFGFVSMLLAVRGLLELLGLMREDEHARPWRETVLGQLEGEAKWQQPLVGGAVATALLVAGALAGYAALPYAIAAALLALAPAAMRRPGLAVFVVVGLVYLPLLGTFSLWDPWETHYGEVAREMISRDDWISLWWAQENWFWSKPILIFWSEALTLSALGVDCSPDANPLHPEWAIRLPVVSFSLAAVMTVYFTLRRYFGGRAGAVAAIALATAPHFFFLSHQAITDMFLVANVTMAICMLALAIGEDPARESRSLRLFGRAFGPAAPLVALITLVGLPQALYLISRNIKFFPTEGFALVGDSFMYGSGGNPGGLGEGQVPGNPELRDMQPFLDGIAAQPFAQGLFWIAGLGVIVWLLSRERRAQALQMFAFYLFCALAFMGKTIPGLAIPGMVALLYLVASRRWDLLFEGRLRVGPGILVALVLGMPWFVAMFIRHGAGFTDRLLVHDNINRVAAGVHGDTGSVQYFLWQLGYATFPWVGLIPAAVLAWLWVRNRDGDRRTAELGGYRTQTQAVSVERERPPELGGYRVRLAPVDVDAREAWHRREVLTLLSLWFFGAFVLFSAMITKFHHYIAPAVPPAVMLAGLLLDRLFGEDGEGSRKQRALASALAMLSPVPLALGLGSLYGDLRGVLPEDVPLAQRQDWVLDHGWPTAASLAAIFVGAAALAWSARWLFAHRLGAKKPERTYDDLSLAVAVGAGAMLVAFVGRDLAWATSARPYGYERLIHLFVYNYGRPWPDHFDYRPILTGFALVAGLLFVGMVVRFTRAAAARALLGFSVLFSAWTLNVYMVDLAPHWGMKELFAAYYAERSGPEEPVFAFQMNWKGENFYTGNRVFAFVDLDNRKLREWIGNNRGKTIFVVTEHTRLGSFRSLVPGREIEEITDKRLNNKFVLVRIREL